MHVHDWIYAMDHPVLTVNLWWLQVSTSMADLCFDVFGIAKEKKDTKSIKGNRGICVLEGRSFLFLNKKKSLHPFFIFRIDYSFQYYTHDN
jgi:hypothetical protein